MRQAAYWRREGDRGAIRCELCPHGCLIAEGRSGLCKVRLNETGPRAEGELRIPYYGLVSSLAMDPIEKKPLHHFLPGSQVFSAGFVGCNMRCPFCQNWRISQEMPASLERFSPESLVAAARRSGAPSIAYTYSEPAVHFEFVMDCMAIARAAGLKNVLVTNGCLASASARELLALADAVNVDLKAWSDEAYARVLGGDKAAVLEFIRIASSLCHLEATTLVVPGLSDSPADIAAISRFLSELSRDIPLHLSAYHPDWKHDAPATSLRLLGELATLARSELRYVYIGNILGEGADTVCPGCGSVVVARRGFKIEKRALAESEGAGRCSNCGRDLHIIV
jgi:pyruvate formate lyase activating enzyme